VIEGQEDQEPIASVGADRRVELEVVAENTLWLSSTPFGSPVVPLE
jgi:hypothetical protein